MRQKIWLRLKITYKKVYSSDFSPSPNTHSGRRIAKIALKWSMIAALFHRAFVWGAVFATEFPAGRQIRVHPFAITVLNE